MPLSEHEVRIAIKARDEATATLQKTEGGLASLRGQLARFGAAWAVMQGIRLSLEGLEVAQASAARTAALASGDVEKMVQAHLAYENSIRSLAASIPIVGGTLQSMFDVLLAGGRTLQENADSIRGWTAAAEKAAQAARQWGREAAVARAGGPEEREALALEHKEEDRAEALATARRELEKATADLDQMERALWRQRRISWGEAVEDMTLREFVKAPFEAIWRASGDGFKLEEAQFRDAAAKREDMARQIEKMEAAAAEATLAQRQEFAEKIQKSSEEALAEQRGLAAREESEAVKAAEDKDRALRDIEYRRQLAGLEGRERELAALDRTYAQERERWREHADVLGALQDAWAADRAAIVTRDERRQAETRAQVLEGLQDELFARTASAQEVALRRWGRRLEDLREQFKGDPEVLAILDELRAAGPARDRAGRGAGGAPLLAARFLRGAPGDDPVQRRLEAGNTHLARVVRLLEEEKTDRRTKPEAPTVQLAAAEE